MPKKGARRRPQDPHAGREAERYDHPIASREAILNLLAERGRPLDHAAIAGDLGLHDERDLEALRRRLRAMQRDGQLHINRRGDYAPVEAIDLLRCRVQGHRDGYGFAIPAAGGDDVFLSARQMRQLFDGDTILVAVSGLDPRGRPEGKVVEVLERGVTAVVGRYEEESGIGFVRPDNSRINQDILIPPKMKGGAKHGQIVSAEITQYPENRLGAKGRIVEVLGEHLDPGLEIDIAIRSHNIPWEWPDDVLEEAGGFRDEPTKGDKQHRVDLREQPFVTIDGEDARDFDDAVFCRRRRGGWTLWVAIADVSHYVAVGSALDREATLRGNSVYFPERVVPMLPEVLSNGLCSLNPQVDRLAMAVEMQVSSAGELQKFSFCEAVIRSQARLTYTQVGAFLADESGHDIPGPLHKPLRELHALYGALRGARELRGAIDFETTETRIIFNEQRKIEAIVPVVRNDAHKLIEECMLCANVAAARFFDRHEMPTLFRVHDGPSEERLENLRAFLGELGLGLRGGASPSPQDYQLLLQHIGERPDAHIIQTMLLRSLSQAVYRPDNGGHFGLNYEAYAHFTSPIRRYPDLLVHRAIRSVIRSKVRSRLVRRTSGAELLERMDIYPYDEAQMAALGEQCSMSERRADDATREVQAWLKCEYLQDHVGDEFDGVVSAVTSFGLFVELAGLYIEGLVHISNLPGDYYHFDFAQQRLFGERSGRSYQLGAPLRVLVAAVNLDERKIDLEPLDGPAPRSATRGRGQKKSASSGASGSARGDGGGRGAGKAKGRTASAGREKPAKSGKPGAGGGNARRGGAKRRRR